MVALLRSSIMHHLMGLHVINDAVVAGGVF